jgi:hypothetical protein
MYFDRLVVIRERLGQRTALPKAREILARHAFTDAVEIWIGSRRSAIHAQAVTKLNHRPRFISRSS